MASGSRPRGARKRKRNRGSDARRRRGRGSRREGAAELGRIAGELAERALADAESFENAEDLEHYASSLVALWTRPEWEVAEELTDALAIAAVSRIARAGGEPALILLRGLASLGDDPVDRLAQDAAAELAKRGVEGPEWLRCVGEAEAVAAKLIRERVYDDGVTVLVELSWPDGRSGAFGVYVDHNLGGMAKDILTVPSIAAVEEIAEKAGEQAIYFEPTSLDDAAARIVAAMDLTDMTFEAPVSDDYRELDAYVTSQVMRMPLEAEPPEHPEVAPEERERLVDAFLATPHGAACADDDDALHVVSLAITFCCDYVDGRPLRWSPVVVELFMADWLPRKVVKETAFYERLPQVLADWIRFAGERRGTPAHAIEETVASVEYSREEMLRGVEDPGAWGPAKTFAMEAKRDGVDIMDEGAIVEYIERRNQAA